MEVRASQSLTNKGRSRLAALLGCLVGLCLALLPVHEIHAQSKKDLSKYAYAKQLLSDGKYAQAHKVLAYFAEDGSENPLYANASYLQGLCKFQQGNTQPAREQLFKLAQQFPEWKGLPEVYFLLAKIDFAWEMPEQAMENLEQLEKPSLVEDAYYLKKEALANYGVAKLKQLRTRYPGDKAVGRVLLGKLYEEGNWEYERALIEKLEERYNPDVQKVALESILKDRYRVGVFFPFNHSSIRTNNPQASFVLDLYEGIKIAQQELSEKGAAIELHAFDTHRDSAATAELLKDEDMKKLDLIIGPIYPSSIRQTKAFSQQYRIPMLNPLREESWMVEGNPQSFLFSTSTEGQADFVADYTFNEMRSLQTYIIYGNKKRDLELAAAYREEVEKRGGTVIESLQFSYDEDSYKNLTEAFDSLTLEQSHVFVTSRDLTVANTLISALQFIDVSTPILAPRRWLERTQLSLSRMASAHVHFYYPLYFEETSPKAMEFQQAYLERLNIYPSKYAYIGYGAMYYFGRMLQLHGIDLANALPEAMPIEMPIFKNPNYKKTQYNATLSIGSFIDGEFETIYPKTAP